MKIAINDKLKCIANLVDEHAKLLDLGCDHALLDIYIAKNKKYKKIVASDNKDGPLEIARENIKKYKLEDEIEVRKGDGLDAYTNDIDTVVISGMGGRTTIGIIKNHLECLKSINTFILSPNNYQEDVRKFLVKNNYMITDEILIKEGKIIYQILKFVKGKIKYKRKEYFFGPILLKNKNKLFYEYCGKELMQREIILNIVPRGHLLYKFRLKREVKMLKKELN